MIQHTSQPFNKQIIGPSSVGSANGGILDVTPKPIYGWAKKITFSLTIHNTNGSPTGGSMNLKFQIGMPIVGTSNLQFTSSILQDLDTAQKINLIAEGEDWPSIPYNATFPYVVSRTISNFGQTANLHMDTSSLTGGTTPTFTYSLSISPQG